MDDSVSRIFVRFKTKDDNEVLWGMWFTREDAIDWANQEMRDGRNQETENPFVGYTLIYVNVLREKLGETYGTRGD